ncbi:MAG: N-methylhydantoinase B/acetone carboxylase, alpha subunit [Sphingomonas bacterium]|nr:N-methylhydantoinase B/acetone carboxylase, alpha subunit [Sphingomonas bacterium]
MTVSMEEVPSLDPVTLEVIRNALPAISDEMSVDLQRTSYNMMIYEVRDYCTALLDIHGSLISQNIGGVSHFVADLGVVVKSGVERYGVDGFRPGDVLIHNHQATAGQHLNNVVLYTPAFFEGELVAFAVVRAHWVDVGGLSTGFGGAGAFDPWSEGLQFDNIKIYEADVPDEKMIRMIRDNIRFPDAAMGDMRSQLAACRLGERRFEELLGRYGKDVVRGAIARIYAETEARCRAAVEEIPDGIYEAESYLDGRGDGPGYEIKVKVTVSGGDMVIDLSGCSQQREGGMNARTFAGAFIAYKALTGPLEPLNEGAFSALEVIIPEGNMMMARFPALMAAWSGPLPTVVDTIWKAFAQALPERIPAAHSGSLGAAFSFSGADRRGKGFVAMSIESGGWGGRPGADGQDVSMSVCQGDVRNSPIENIELKTPLMVVERALRADSGGAGEFRGGLGIQTHAKALVAGRWNSSSGDGGRRTCPPWGLAGGKPGKLAETLVKRADEVEFHAPSGPGFVGGVGAEILYRTAGGGGWGDPRARDPERVLADVREGYVSLEAAREDYGVAITDALEIDATQTARLRGAERAKETM